MSTHIFIGVGVNPDSAKKAREAGANILVSGAYIFNSGNIEEAIKEFDLKV